MKVNQAMTRPAVTVREDTTVRTALRLLADHRITMLPVVDEKDRILGVVSEVDLVRGRVLPVVGEVMSHGTVRFSPEADLLEVARVVGTTDLKSFPVVDADERVVGVVSRSDVVRMLARDDDVLREEIGDALTLAGLRGWRVEVHNGVAELSHPDGPGAGSRLARSIAQSTPGVSTVTTL
ncbi:CBS domain-containing protein [Nocardioides pelophilus]|uniref:CBS domain-containing protein n=1 Tax=Nocardioides pelophilus TaxID=2172019 RepID=UPI0015FEEC61|nr:CBS domain-containing protein [Nocardioides pelophilus]